MTNKQIEVYRDVNDQYIDQVRVRIWIPPAPSYDSLWTSIDPDGIEKNFEHSIGGDTDDYVVHMDFKDLDVSGLGINQVGFGHNEYSRTIGDKMNGAAWMTLDNNLIKVVRQFDDSAADEVHVRIWKNIQPDYDSKWTILNKDKSMEFPHNLKGTTG